MIMSTYLDFIKKHLLGSAETQKLVAEQLAEQISRAAETCIASIRKGGKIMFCGNGGSAADSQHLATEMVVRLSADLDRGALPALALTTDTSILTACGNDYGFDHIFARQVEAVGKPEDILIAISTSGNSPNILKAVESAKIKGIAIIGFLGKDGGRMKNLIDIPIIVPSADVQHIQESHIAIGHILIGIIEAELAKK
jgi:D-sedoheptulose 7-phosphate isomerase